MLFFDQKSKFYTVTQRTQGIQSYIDKVESLSRGHTLPDFKSYYKSRQCSTGTRVDKQINEVE